MTLTDHLIARIQRTGPLTVADYMAECMLHPTLGYYTTRDPLGAAGDFTTAPEISQMFGELIGLSLAQTWLNQGAPAPFILAEAGPGRGTLMADILRATRSVPGFHTAMRLHLIEASPTLRKIQADALSQYTPTWHGTVSDLPDGPLFFIANEFFDALPIRQFTRAGTAWQERRVAATNGALGFAQTEPTPIPALDHRLSDTQDGDLVELCPSASAIAAELGQRIAQQGGAALIVDYGDWRSLGDTLQAMHRHQHTDPLTSPGQCDLTAHVDFEALATAATPAKFTRLSTQGVFLERLGITDRAQTLASKLGGADLDNLIAAHRRLTHPAEMGTLFKVLGLYPNGQTPPPGLEA